MYVDYWGLTETPFSGPDETYWFYESPFHEEALARLSFLADEPPCCGLLCGPAGAGKSLLLEIARRRRGAAGRTALRLETAGRGGHELLWELAAGFGLAPSDSASEAALWRTLRDHLDGLRLARVPILLLFDDIDRAEIGGQRAVERLLAETPGIATLAVVLAAQEDGQRRLSGRLLDRCDLRIELPPLDEEQTARLVLELLARAGTDSDVFDQEALAALYERTDGIPRRIRRLCDLSLLAGMSEPLDVIDAGVVHAAADELQARHPVAARTPNLRPATARF
ncbi:MAG: AAA family ATPase [Planctomycetales bacterium]